MAIGYFEEGQGPHLNPEDRARLGRLEADLRKIEVQLEGMPRGPEYAALFESIKPLHRARMRMIRASAKIRKPRKNS